MWRISEFSSLAIVKSCAVSQAVKNLWKKLHDWIGTWAAKNPATSLLEFLSSDCLCPTLAGINIFLDGFIPTVPGTKCLFVCIWCFEGWSKSHKVLASSFWKFMFMFWSLILKTWGEVTRHFKESCVLFSNAWFKHYLEMPRNLWCRPKKL